MTDKEQIIIDGVDVTKCPISEKCKEFENCKIQDILKQLARKTQECDILKSQLDFAVQQKECLEQECEELKKIIENQRKEIYRHRHKQAELKEKIKTLDGESITVQLTESEFAEYQSLKKQNKEFLAINNRRKDQIKTLKYMLFEERELTQNSFRANFKIAKLKRDMNSHKARWKNEFKRCEQALEKIEELAKDIVEKDCYENSDTKANKVLDIISKAKEK